MVFLGHGESGKTLQRGLRAGALRPSEKDERTIQLDIYSLLLGEGANTVLMSMWDLAGQPQYAAGLQPYIVAGSLYLLLVPALPVAELDSNYPDYLGRWMDYLQVAPDAVVQPVLDTAICCCLPEAPTGSRLEAAATAQTQWIMSNIDSIKARRAKARSLCACKKRSCAFRALEAATTRCSNCVSNSNQWYSRHRRSFRLLASSYRRRGSSPCLSSVLCEMAAIRLWRPVTPSPSKVSVARPLPRKTRGQLRLSKRTKTRWRQARSAHDRTSRWRRRKRVGRARWCQH